MSFRLTKKLTFLLDILLFGLTRFSKQNRSTEGCSKLKRSVDMTSSGKNGLNIRTNVSPKWDRTRCPEESVHMTDMSKDFNISGKKKLRLVFMKKKIYKRKCPARPLATTDWWWVLKWWQVVVLKVPPPFHLTDGTVTKETSWIRHWIITHLVLLANTTYTTQESLF